MTKSECIQNLKASRSWNHFHDSQAWTDAFLFYNASHGLSGKDQLRMNCSKCFITVRDWLLIEPRK